MPSGVAIASQTVSIGYSIRRSKLSTWLPSRSSTVPSFIERRAGRRFYGVVRVPPPLGVVLCEEALLDGGTRTRPCVAGSGGGAAGVVGAGVVLCECRLVGFLFSLVAGGLTGVTGFESTGGGDVFAG